MIIYKNNFIDYGPLQTWVEYSVHDRTLIMGFTEPILCQFSCIACFQVIL
jgi:hypothetical protein